MIIAAAIALRREQKKAGILEASSGIETGGLERIGSCLKHHPQQITLRLSAGEWRLDIWKNRQREAFFKDTSLRSVTVSVTDPEDPSSPVGSAHVKELSMRSSVPITVDGPEPRKVTLTFTTPAFWKPVKFHFVLTQLESIDPDSDVSKSAAVDPVASLVACQDLDDSESDPEVMLDAEEEDEVAGLKPERDEYTGEALEDTNGYAMDDSEDQPEAIVERVPRYSLEWLEHMYGALPSEVRWQLANNIRLAQERGWPSMEGACAATYDNTQAIVEMGRESKYKTKARESGLIRPFLLLVSMHPGRRAGRALSLGLQLTRKSLFGDSHWESYEILFHPRRGVVSLASKTFREQFNPFSRKVDWYQLLHRIIYRAHSTKKGPKNLFGEETMAPELLERLETAKVSKNDSKELCSDTELAIAPDTLENLYARTFQSLRFGQYFQANTHKLLADKLIPENTEESLGKVLSKQDLAQANELDIETIMEEARNLVAQDPEMAAKAAILRRRGVTDENSVAIIVLNAYHKHSSLILPSNNQDGSEGSSEGETGGDVKLTWNKQWGSMTMTLTQEFKEMVEAKARKEKTQQQAISVAAGTIPIIISALTLNPAVALVMTSRAAFKAAFPTLPTSVAAILSGIILQKQWLAVQDIGIEEYY